MAGAGGGLHRDESALPQHEGFVVTLKEAYGFVQCVDSEQQYFFHYSELRNCDKRDLRPGAELLFQIKDPRTGEKPTGIHATLLPKGTIKTEVAVATDLRGLVHKEPKLSDGRGSDRRSTDKRGDVSIMGRVKTIAGQSGLDGQPAPDSAVFAIEDAVALDDGGPYKPHTEDEVLFDMVLVSHHCVLFARSLSLSLSLSLTHSRACCPPAVFAISLSAL